MNDNYAYTDLTRKIIGCAFNVHNELGEGFLEKVYENALKVELMEAGLIVKQQEPINVYYKKQLIGEYVVDLLVEDKVIVELKAVKKINDVHEVQLVNYLKATNKQIGLIINFAKSVEVKRKILTAQNNQKIKPKNQ